MHHDDIGGALRRQVPQHCHNRGDTAAGGHEQDLGRSRKVQCEVAGRLVELHYRSDGGAPHQVIAHDAARDGFHSDGKVAVRAVGPRGH